MPLWFKKHSSRPPLQKGGHSDIGLVRQENQDAFGLFPPNGRGDEPEQLFLVADGMGGHEDGRRASQTALAVISDVYFRQPSRAPQDRLAAAFRAANDGIQRASPEATGLEQAGTTCTALALSGGHLYVAHVGDSRAYRIRADGVEPLTTDHTLVEELRRDGVLSAEEARRHPRRNVLNRALGLAPDVEVDVARVGAPAPGEAYLLCTDGIAKVTPDELRAAALGRAPQDACEHLTTLANERGGRDNATVVIVRFG